MDQLCSAPSFDRDTMRTQTEKDNTGLGEVAGFHLHNSISDY